LRLFARNTLAEEDWQRLEHADSRNPTLDARHSILQYLLIADIQNTALSAFLIFSERVLYPTYAAVPRLWGITALDDQAAAGAIMWVPGSVIFLIPVAVLAIRLLDLPRTRSMKNKLNYGVVKVE